MSSYFNCAAYDDVDITIRLNDNVVFLALKIKAKDMTCTSIQMRMLVKYLTAALKQIDFTNLENEEHFSNLIVEIEHDNSQYEILMTEFVTCLIGVFNSTTIAFCLNALVSKSCTFRRFADSIKLSFCGRLSRRKLCRRCVPSVNAGAIVNVWDIVPLVRIASTLRSLLLLRRKVVMNFSSPLRFFTVEYDAAINSISPNVMSDTFRPMKFFKVCTGFSTVNSLPASRLKLMGISMYDRTTWLCSRTSPHQIFKSTTT